MDSLSTLIKKKELLPKGNIYQKNINGHSYYYYQYFEDGKIVSKLIKDENELEQLSNNISKRKEIEKQIKSYQKKRNIILSKSAKSLTGDVMSGNRKVATFDHSVLTWIDEQYAPLVIKKTHSLERFLELRLIDMSRTNARILKRIFDLQMENDYEASLYVYALSVSDNYWFKPKHSKLKYDDLIFNNDLYSETSLNGQILKYPHKIELTPELTTAGSFEKGWKYLDSHWWLYKNENDKQKFSEIFSSRFASLIEIPTVFYELDKEYIRCKNFAEDVNYEPIASLVNQDDRYETIFPILYELDREIAKQYLKLIFFDSVINNVDRHTENLGLLRNINDGTVISLAPNFDNNLALIATTNRLNDNPSKDPFIQIFVKFLKGNVIAKELFLEIEFKEISEIDIKNILPNIDIEIDKEELVKTIFKRFQYLKNIYNK